MIVCKGPCGRKLNNPSGTTSRTGLCSQCREKENAESPRGGIGFSVNRSSPTVGRIEPVLEIEERDYDLDDYDNAEPENDRPARLESKDVALRVIGTLFKRKLKAYEVKRIKFRQLAAGAMGLSDPRAFKAARFIISPEIKKQIHMQDSEDILYCYQNPTAPRSGFIFTASGEDRFMYSVELMKDSSRHTIAPRESNQ